MRHLMQVARRVGTELLDPATGYFEPLDEGDVVALEHIAVSRPVDPGALFSLPTYAEQAVRRGVSDPALCGRAAQAFRDLVYVYCNDTGIVTLRNEIRAYDQALTRLCDRMSQAATTLETTDGA